MIADQDASGPGGSDMMSLLVFLQSPDVHLLGITVVTGDAWRDEEVAHALRLVETVGRTDVKVYPGAAFPLVRTLAWTTAGEEMYGTASFEGAWCERRAAWHGIRFRRCGGRAHDHACGGGRGPLHGADGAQYPHKVTIYGAGPLTDVALAIRLDPHFAELAQELVVMGGSIVPDTEAAEWYERPAA